MAEAIVTDIAESTFLRRINIQTLVDFKPTTQLRELYHQRREQTLETYSNVHVSMDRFVTQLAPASYKPFYLLKRAVLNELKLGSAAEGRYITVRVLESGFIMCGWSSVIDDENGVACDIDVHNYPTLETFCIGTVLIIKEPYLTLSITGNPLIRCDCPTDIFVLRRNDSLGFLTDNIVWKNSLGEMQNHETIFLEQPSTFSSTDWKRHGEEMLQGGQFSLAIECFLLGSENCSTRSVIYTTLHSMLCTVYFKLGYYEKAIAISRSMSLNENAMNAVGQAYYCLRKYEDALRVFKSIVKSNPCNHFAVNFCKKCNLRVSEDCSERSIMRLEIENRNDQWMKLDHADCTGLVNVVPVPVKGRGIVLTEDVEPDTVLIVSKAFVSYFNPREASDLHCKMSSRDYSAGDLRIIAEIAEAITRNPGTFGKMIYDLRRAYEPSEELQRYRKPSTRSQFICDVRRIEAIYRNNRFFITADIDWQTKAIGAGLFIYPSYLNHSCEPNVYATFYNDVMVVRSMRHMRKDEELLISYVPVDWPFEKRVPFFIERDFMCDCRFCEARI